VPVTLFRVLIAVGLLAIGIPAVVLSAASLPTSSPPAASAPEGNATTTDRTTERAAASTSESSSAARARAGAPLVVAAGDIATGARADNATARLVRRTNPRRVLVLGDNVYPTGSRLNYRRFYDPSWGTFKRKTRPAPGNHDYRPGTGTPHHYYRYFANQLPNQNGGRYYAYNAGSWRLYSLNCEVPCGAGSRQVSWLRRDLATNGAGRHKLAYLHRPRYSCGTHGSSTLPTALWNRLLAANTDVVLAGHDHNYQRYPRMNANGSPAPQGIMSFVVGTGGGRLYRISGNEPTQGCARAQFVQSRSHGVLRLRLGATSFRWAFATPRGRMLDSGSSPTLPQP